MIVQIGQTSSLINPPTLSKGRKPFRKYLLYTEHRTSAKRWTLLNRFLIASKAKTAFTVCFFMSSDKGVYVSIYAEITIFKDANTRLPDILIRQKFGKL